ncbi:MAG: hypothetical protein WBV73_14670, partial [Phormidium sp.]
FPGSTWERVLGGSTSPAARSEYTFQVLAGRGGLGENSAIVASELKQNPASNLWEVITFSYS